MSAPEVPPRSWIGRRETVHDIVGPTPVAALTATLDPPASPVASGTALPQVNGTLQDDGAATLR